MPKRREQTLFELGCKAFEQHSKQKMALVDKAYMYAMATMLAEATKKPTKKKKADETVLVISPKEMYETIRDNCGDKVACEPYDSRWFGRLGSRLKDIPDLERGDLQRLVSFINGSGISFWKTTFTFGHLIKWLPEMIAKARKEQRGTEANTRQVRDAFA